MFRFALSLLGCLFCCGCMSQAQLKAAIEANKIPPVQLSETQIAKLKEMAPNDQIVWYGAGQQSDGKIFVCLVTSGKNPFAVGNTQLFTGTFESDGSFQQTWARFLNKLDVVNDCRRRGFDPPVTIRNY